MDIDLFRQRWRAKARMESRFRQYIDQSIDHVLEHSGCKKTKAADILGIDPSTLHRRGKARG